MSEQFVPEQLMKDYYTAYNSENSQALRAFYHDDVLMVSAQGESVGADAIIDTYQHLIDLFHDQMTPVKPGVKPTTIILMAYSTATGIILPKYVWILLM